MAAAAVLVLPAVVSGLAALDPLARLPRIAVLVVAPVDVGLLGDHSGPHERGHEGGCSGHRWPRRPDIDPSDKPEPRMRRYATEWSSKPTEADELTDTNDRSKP